MSDSPSLKRILIFDDDSDYRKLLTAWLEKMFTEIELEEYDPVENGVPDEVFDWSRYDVLLLDYFLCIHGTTGLDILQANRKNPLFPATIMLTGAGNEEIAVKAVKAGVREYLRKDDLDKHELRTAILNAFVEHGQNQERLKDITSQSFTFNKSLFYRQLEHTDDSAANRVLLLVKLDNEKLIEEQLGSILRGRILRHVSKRCLETFDAGNCNPSITRFSDTSVALIIDDPGSGKALRFNLQGVCDYLTKTVYKHEGKPYHHTVSIGAVPLPLERGPAKKYIKLARSTCEIAAQLEGNSFHIYESEPVEPEQADTPGIKSDGEHPPAVTPTDNTNISGDQAVVTHELELDETGMGEQALALKIAFDEKRIIQTFKPVISLFSDEESEEDVYMLSLQLIDTDGSTSDAEQVYAHIDTPAFQKFVDRWMLREAIARVIGGNQNKYVFIIRLSEASLADSGLFDWIRNLFSWLDAELPDACMVLEISAQDYLNVQKQADALISYLKKFHGIRFALGELNGVEVIKKITGSKLFDLLITSGDLIQAMTASTSEGQEEGSLLQQTKSDGIRIIAEKICDSTMLTEVISLGADFAAGDFIGDEVNQLDESTNIESFEII